MLFKEGNDLLKAQIAIQTDALLNDKDHKAAYLDLERKKRKSEIRPFFKTQGFQGIGGSFTLIFINYGERAFIEGIVSIDVSEIDILPQSTQKQTIEKDELYRFKASSNSFINLGYSGYNVPLKVKLLFKDGDGNLYSQTITRLQGEEATIDNPEEVL